MPGSPSPANPPPPPLPSNPRPTSPHTYKLALYISIQTSIVILSQALTPLTIGRNRFAASALGALWGFGHSTGQLILGLVFVVLKVRGWCLWCSR